MAKLEQETYSHSEVEQLIGKILNQDSMGDIFYYGRQILAEHGMSIVKPEDLTTEDEDQD